MLNDSTSVRQIGYAEALSGYKVDNSLQQPESPARFRNRQAQSAACTRRPRAYIPEFRDILGRRRKPVAAHFERSHGGADRSVQWVVAINQTQQNARVKDNNHQS
jgi:hypothetical protein